MREGLDYETELTITERASWTCTVVRTFPEHFFVSLGLSKILV